MDLKQHGAHFVLCHEKGHKIEVVVLNRVCILGSFSPKRGKSFQRLPFTQIDQQERIQSFLVRCQASAVTTGSTKTGFFC